MGTNEENKIDVVIDEVLKSKRLKQVIIIAVILTFIYLFLDFLDTKGLI